MSRYGLKELLALAGDIGVFYLALFVFSIVRYRLDWLSGWQINEPTFTLILPLWLLIFFVGELYEKNYFRFDLRLTRLIVANVLAASILSVILFYLFPAYLTTPKTNLVIFAIVFVALILSWRWLFFKLIGLQVKTRVLFVGESAAINGLDGLFKVRPELGYLTADKLPRSEPEKIRQCLKNGIDLVVVKDLKESRTAADRALSAILLSGASVLSLEDFYERITGRVSIDLLNEMWFIDHLGSPEARLNSVLIWSGEKIFSLIGSIILGILFPFIALGIKLDSRGPIIYRQKRIGRNGKIFTIYKFRTMHALNQDGSAEPNGPERTLKNDKRITSFGRILRFTKLDELPQLWNVLVGDMGIVGPRPERPEEFKELAPQLPFNDLRLLVKPGVTGWAQINYKAPTNLDELRIRLAYDLYYIKNRSVVLDLIIALRTAKEFFGQADER